MKKSNLVLTTVGLIVILFAGYVYFAKSSYINDPLFFFIGWPEELSKPIFKEFIEFSKEGYVKDIKATIKYPHSYEFEIYDENGKIPKLYKYAGVVKIEILKDGRVRQTLFSNESRGGEYSSGIDNYRSVVIAESRVNLRGRVAIRITVVKADPKVNELGNKIYLTMDGAPTN